GPTCGLSARPRGRRRAAAGGPGPPLLEIAEEHGEVHRLWRVTDAGAVAQVAAALAGETIFIADGHHRYETALAYRAERGTEGPSSILAFLSNMEEPGLVVLPTHRLLRAPLRLAPADLEARVRESFAVAPLERGPRPPAASPPAGCACPRRRRGWGASRRCLRPFARSTSPSCTARSSSRSSGSRPGTWNSPTRTPRRSRRWIRGARRRPSCSIPRAW